MRSLIALLILLLAAPVAGACPVRQRSVQRVIQKQVHAPVIAQQLGDSYYESARIIGGPVQFRTVLRQAVPEIHYIEQPQIILEQEVDHCNVGFQRSFSRARSVRVPAQRQVVRRLEINRQGEVFPVAKALARGTARVLTAPFRAAQNLALRAGQRQVSVRREFIRTVN